MSYGVFFYDAQAPEAERYKWSQASTIPDALAQLEREFPNMPNPYDLNLVEVNILEVVAPTSCTGDVAA